MALILNIETATRVCSVALALDGDVVSFREQHDEQFTHAENLNRFVKEVMSEANKNFSDLEGIAVSRGPGSYTGLRIGVSTAKGYCYARNIPLIAVDTLRAMASGVQVEEGAVIIPMIDARRMEVYCAVYDHQLNEQEPVDAVILDETTFSDYPGKKYLLGDGAAKFAELVGQPTIELLDKYPSARTMAALAEENYRLKRFEDVAYFEPFYLKDFVAGKPKKLI